MSTNWRDTLYLADLSHLKPLCVMSKRHGNRRNKHKWRKTKRHNFMNPEGINALPKACDRNFNIKRQCCQNSLVTRSAGSILKIRDSTMQVSEWKSYRKDGFNFKNLLFFQMFSQNSEYHFVSWKETIVTTFNNLKQKIESFNILYGFGILVWHGVLTKSSNS